MDIATKLDNWRIISQATPVTDYKYLINSYFGSCKEEEEIINIQDEDGTTPLHLAAASKNANLISYLIAQGADTEIRNSNGELFSDLLATEADITEKHEDKASTPSIAIKHTARPIAAPSSATTTELLKDCNTFLKQHKARPIKRIDAIVTYDKFTVFHFALQTGNFDLAKRLLLAGANYDTTTKDGVTPLMTASNRSYTITKLLLEKGCDLDRKDSAGYTALMNAAVAQADSEALVTILITSGAQVNLMDDEGKTALDHCQNSAVRELLSTHGAKSGAEIRQAASVDIKQADPITHHVALVSQLEKGRIEESHPNEDTLSSQRSSTNIDTAATEEKRTLIRISMEHTHSSSSNQSSSAIYSLSSSPGSAAMAQRMNIGLVPRPSNSAAIPHYLAYYTKEQLLKKLNQVLMHIQQNPLQKELFTSEITTLDQIVSKDMRLTPLHLAAASIDPHFLPSFLHYTKDSLNAQTHDGRTPIMIAAAGQKNPLPRVKLLIDAGADLTIRSNAGKTALDYATDPAVRDLILSAMQASAIPTAKQTTPPQSAAHAAINEEERVLKAFQQTMTKHITTLAQKVDTLAQRVDTLVQRVATMEPSKNIYLLKEQLLTILNQTLMRIKQDRLQKERYISEITTLDQIISEDNGLTTLHLIAGLPDQRLLPSFLHHTKDSLNAQTHDGRTSIMLAAAGQKNPLPRVKTLIDAGADLTIRSNAGKTALDYATDPAVRDLILSAMQASAIPTAKQTTPPQSAAHAAMEDGSSEVEIVENPNPKPKILIDLTADDIAGPANSNTTSAGRHNPYSYHPLLDLTSPITIDWNYAPPTTSSANAGPIITSSGQRSSIVLAQSNASAIVAPVPSATLSALTASVPSNQHKRSHTEIEASETDNAHDVTWVATTGKRHNPGPLERTP